MRKPRNNKQVTDEQIANSITLGMEFRNADLIDWLAENDVYMETAALGCRMREYARLGLVERVRLSKGAIWKVSATQYKLLIEHGEQKIRNKQIAAAKRHPNPIRKKIVKRVCGNEQKWASKSRMIGNPGETILMRGV